MLTLLSLKIVACDASCRARSKDLDNGYGGSGADPLRGEAVVRAISNCYPARIEWS